MNDERLFLSEKATKFELCKRCLNCFYINHISKQSCSGCGMLLIREAVKDEMPMRQLKEHGEEISK